MSYRVQCTETYTGRELSPDVTNNTYIIISGLHPYTNYSCNVSASANSSYLVDVTTHEDGTHLSNLSILDNNIPTLHRAVAIGAAGAAIAAPILRT